MTIAGYKKAIAKLLKAYHKKWDCFGKPIPKKKSKKRSKKRSRKRSKKRNRKRNKISRTC
jgi:hypothetical protein